MATLSARVKTPAVAALATLKAGSPYTVTMTITDRFDTSDFVAIGVSADQPAAYSDLSNVTGNDLDGVDSLSFKFTVDGTTVVTGQSFAPNDFVAGNHVWVCLFAGPGTPDSSDAPLAVAGPFVVAA